MNIGVVATRIPASPEEISSSPSPISTNGTATCTEPISRNQPASGRSPRSAPRDWASGTRISAASAIRTKAIISGVRSRSPILMNMYDAPQIAPRISSIVQERRSIDPT